MVKMTQTDDIIRLWNAILTFGGAESCSMEIGELLRGVLSKLYENTTTIPKLKVKMLEFDLINEIDADYAMSKSGDYEQCECLYKKAFKRNDFPCLIKALHQSGHDHVIQIIYDHLKENHLSTFATLNVPVPGAASKIEDSPETPSEPMEPDAGVTLLEHPNIDRDVSEPIIGPNQGLWRAEGSPIITAGIVTCAVVTLVMLVFTVVGITSWSKRPETGKEVESLTFDADELPLTNPTITAETVEQRPRSAENPIKMVDESTMLIFPKEHGNWNKYLHDAYQGPPITAIEFAGVITPTQVIYTLQKLQFSLQNMAFYLGTLFCNQFQTYNVSEENTSEKIALDSLTSLTFTGSEQCGGIYPFLRIQLHMPKVRNLTLENVKILDSYVEDIDSLLVDLQGNLEYLQLRKIALGKNCNIFKSTNFTNLKEAHVEFGSGSIYEESINNFVSNFQEKCMILDQSEAAKEFSMIEIKCPT